MLRSDLYRRFARETYAMYKEFAVEAVMWLVPVVVLIGVALLVTA
jgi:hypothetical protein